ncbi:hypothetical protein SAMN04487868_105225 [Marinobacter salarius]|jgi:hypothetical protein|uniref:Type II restriction endonuclease subunit M n=1 Tax=Marinobacter salarius TaxID=1420917 RepID=A0ABY1FMF6_9GAMM|nr:MULTISPECIES: type II restriction endonuclease subunit M [Marinobacter]SFL63666.1 hypothetical protein SAMN04487868_105225 [Marinobacter salarius]
MSNFLRLLTETDKHTALSEVCNNLRRGEEDERIFQVAPEIFNEVPGIPFSYWVNDSVRSRFSKCAPFENSHRNARQGLATGDDFRFVRLHWEVVGRHKWLNFAKGGSFSPFFYDLHLVVNWQENGVEIRNFVDESSGKLKSRPQNIEFFKRAGLTWPRRTTSGLSVRVLPADAVFADKGPALFVSDDDPDELLALLAITNSQAFATLLSVQLAAADAAARSYEVGLIQKNPVCEYDAKEGSRLSEMARRLWSLKRQLDTTTETSHAFLLPELLRNRLGDYNPVAIEEEIGQIQREIDSLVFDLYGFSEEDRLEDLTNKETPSTAGKKTEEKDDIELITRPEEDVLSWAVGVAFGRFDWRLANGERRPLAEPCPFAPLPAKSPGMHPDGVEVFHHHHGVLVDDEGHSHDLNRLVERVLETVDANISRDTRRWLRKDFFQFHLQRYSKSRRKAPIYWPISTFSGNYTLWLYYPLLSSQTLFTIVNDFVDPKLKSVRSDLNSLRIKSSGRSKQEEKEFETLSNLEKELADLCDMLLGIAPSYRPKHDDGVLICAAPLWSLYANKSWKMVLKDIWNQLEEGDYDWAHLALNYWPERVLQKCIEDRSLAIAHDVERLFWEEIEVPVIRRGQDTGEIRLDWQPKGLSEADTQTLIKKVIDERGLQSEFR